ncbi:MAG: cation diffusion facilitator family transporter [Anaerolineae bacterium]
MSSIESGLQASGVAITANLVLAIVKIAAGTIGNSYALVADGIESTADILSSLIVWSGLRISARPPDSTHPYGHGKAESIAGVMVSLFLLGAAFLIAIQSIREIRTPHHTPEWYTLVVLGGVIVTKEALFRFVFRVGNSLASTSLRSDAWHHRSDAITSLAAFVGISIALIGGPGYESADDWAALIACGVIVYNGVRLLRPAMDEVMDAAVAGDVESEVRRIAAEVSGVVDVEKCRIRKSGVGLLMDIHITVDGDISVRSGHEIGHIVKDHLCQSELPIHDVIVHIEPHHPNNSY